MMKIFTKHFVRMQAATCSTSCPRPESAQAQRLSQRLHHSRLTRSLRVAMRSRGAFATWHERNARSHEEDGEEK